MIREIAKRDAQAAHAVGAKYRTGGWEALNETERNLLDPTHTGYDERDLLFEGSAEELEELIFERYCRNWSASI